MLVQFTLKNFCSFKDEHTISFLASNDKNLRDDNTFQVNSKTRLLHTAVLYGANASGKTNIFKALHFFLQFAVTSGPHMQKGDRIGINPFILSKSTVNEPSFFELVFYHAVEGREPIRYRYGLQLSQDHVIEEYLYAVNNLKEVMLFYREGQKIECSLTNFKEGLKVPRDTVRENASFLSVCAQTNGEIAGRIITYFRVIGIFSGNEEFPPIAMYMKPNDEMHARIINFLHFADLQIDDYQKRKLPVDFAGIADPEFRDFLKSKMPDGYSEKLFFGHPLYDGNEKIGIQYIPEEEESTGTNKLFSYSSVILDVLSKGGVLFADEFDSSLHPLIVENIIKLFNSPKDNPHNAQLVISCQSVHIMTNKLFRRDQIWFCEKDQHGASDLYSLFDFDEPVRKDASYNKNYLKGKYGAIPAIDEIRLHMGEV